MYNTLPQPFGEQLLDLSPLLGYEYKTYKVKSRAVWAANLEVHEQLDIGNRRTKAKLKGQGRNLFTVTIA